MVVVHPAAGRFPMESLRSRAISALVNSQNPEGGWAYQGTVSWTEPGAFALLALRSEPQASECVARGIRYLSSLQRPDGGWPPQAAIGQSTWVTAAAILALSDRLSPAALDQAVSWLLSQRGEETGLVRRLRLWMLGAGSIQTQGEGWPWYPETAGWVAPTACTILALDKLRQRRPSEVLEARLRSARSFLWLRVCADGGWNHGSTRALGYEAASYPETTGLALAALRGSSSPKLPAALAAAERHLSATRSSSARSWLRLGLLAHRRPAATPGEEPPWRGVMDTALYVLAEQAAAGNSPLWM